MAVKDLLIKLGVKGADKTEKQLGKTESAMKNLGSAALKVGGAFFAAQGIISGLRTVVDAAARQEQAEKSLQVALGRTSKSLLNQASALQKVTTAGDEAIIEQQAFLASLKFTEDQIKTIIPVALDLSAATGISLESAVRNTSKTFSGLAGELGELVPQLRDLTQEEMKAGEAVKVLGNLFAGQASQQAQTMSGSLQQMTNAVGDAAEEIGNLLAPIIISVSKSFKAASEVIGDFFKKLSPPDFDDIIENLKSVNAQVGLIANIQKLKLTSELIEVNNELRSLGEENTTLAEVGEQTKEVTEGLTFQMVAQANAIAMNERKTAGFKQGLIENYQEQAKSLTQIGELITRREKLNELIKAINFSEKESTEIKKESTETTQAVIPLMESELALRKSISEFQVEFFEMEKMTDAERLSAKEEFNNAMQSMFETDFNMQRSIMSDQVKRFRAAGIEEINIAKFVAEQKKQIKNAEVAHGAEKASQLIGLAKNAASTNKNLARVTQGLAYGEAVIKAYESAVKSYAMFGGYPTGVIPAGLSFAFGMSQAEAIRSQKFAKGGIVQGVNSGAGDSVPTMLTPGEVILNQAQQENLVGQVGGMTINFNAPVTNEDFVKDFVIPEIEKTVSGSLA